jgi:hypothetical protein
MSRGAAAHTRIAPVVRLSWQVSNPAALVIQLLLFSFINSDLAKSRRLIRDAAKRRETRTFGPHCEIVTKILDLLISTDETRSQNRAMKRTVQERAGRAADPVAQLPAISAEPAIREAAGAQQVADLSVTIRSHRARLEATGSLGRAHMDAKMCARTHAVVAVGQQRTRHDSNLAANDPLAVIGPSVLPWRTSRQSGTYCQS